MLRLVAAITLFAFTLLVGADALCCPDGCTGGSDQSTSTESASQKAVHIGCVLCALGIDAPGVLSTLVRGGNISVVPVAIVTRLRLTPPVPLDHPPRA